MKTREEALELLKEYNKDEFHIKHGLTVEGTMDTLTNPALQTKTYGSPN